MSGTSIDGVDYALCEIDDRRVQLRELWLANFPSALRRRLHEAARGAANSWDVAQLHHDLGRFYATAAVRPRQRLKPQLVGLHGQTIFHNPSQRAPATFQLGEPAYLSEAFGVPAVSNFRVADLAAGGQGAPLATLFHVRAFGERGRHVCVNNLGGISNVTSIDWRATSARPKVLAFDTGPANVLIDLAMRSFGKEFDRNGAWAAKGTPGEPLLARWLKHPFFHANPPKSTGRELFGEPFFKRAMQECQRARLSKFDIVATFTAFTARSLALNYRAHLPGVPTKVILAGGGASNGTLRRLITDALRELNPEGPVPVQTSEDCGWPVQSIEPAAFALLAWMRLRGKPGNLPETTGASRSVLLGQITSPRQGW